VTIRDSLERELAAAMRRRDSSVVAVLRSAISAIANAQAVPTQVEEGTAEAGSVHFAGAAHGIGAAEAARLTLTEEQQRAIITGEVTELSAHVHRLESLGRPEESAATRRALRILTRLL
jgi:hypothetical protein